MRFLLICCAVVMLSGCSSPDIIVLTSLQPSANELAALNAVCTNIVGKFNKFDNAMRMTVIRLHQEKMKGPGTLNALKGLQRTLEFVRMAGSLDLHGKRIEVYPEIYYKEAKIPPKVHDIDKALPRVAKGDNYLGEMFQNGLGTNVVNYYMPVMGEDEIVIGIVYIQIAVTKLLEHIVERKIVGLNVNIWIIQTDGVILYDTAPEEIGLNVFRDQPFVNHPSLVRCAEKIMENETGTGSYFFTTKGTGKVLQKNAQWNTLGNGGMRWKIILNLEDRSYMKH